MITEIQWPGTAGPELASPFAAGNRDRTLKITLHSESLANLSESERLAYEALRELSYLPDVEILQTRAGEFPEVYVNPEPRPDGYLTVEVRVMGQSTVRNLGIHPSRLSLGLIQMLSGIPEASDPEHQAMKEDLTAVEAHFALERDLFVTSSTRLLENKSSVSYANPCLPSEAAKVLGLLLRSRDNWVFARQGGTDFITDRGMFYWRLMRAKLPSFWRYFSGCLRAEEKGIDELGRLGQSVMERCSRALQARDEIGINFYRNQNNNTRDAMMYHFDYLTLLLVGAFDAQAHIANHVYHLIEDELQVGFRRRHFVEALSNSDGKGLCDVIDSPEIGFLMVLLHTLRNTIHGANLGTYAFVSPGEVEKSFIRIPASIQQQLWEAADSVDSPDEWGLKKDEYFVVERGSEERVKVEEIALEPYAYASRLEDCWHRVIDHVAELTEIELILNESEVATLNQEPPADWLPMTERVTTLA